MSADAEPHYSSDPRTIWALPENMRAAAVADIFRQASVMYHDASLTGDKKTAQDSALQAIAVIGGLFPDREDPAHHLIAGLQGALVAARSGSTAQILLQPGLRIAGTKKGLGAAAISAGAVAAVQILMARQMSGRAARKHVAQMLGKRGYSRKNGEHDQPTLITASAIRSWAENPERYPIVAKGASLYREYLEQRIAELNLETVEQIITFLDSLTDKFLMNHRAI